MQSNRPPKIILTISPLLIVLFVCPACLKGGVAQNGKMDTVLVAFTANNNGQLLDCGCDVEVPGGLPRRQTALKALRREYGDLLLLDGGDLFSPTKILLQNEFVLGAYDSMGYQAIAIGDQELWAGEDSFLKLISESRIPFLGTTFPAASSSSGILPRLAIRQNGFDILVLAILHSSSFEYFSQPEAPSLPVEYLKEVLTQELRDHATPDGLTIVLFHGNRDELAEFRADFPQVSLWLQGHEPSAGGRSSRLLELPAIVGTSSDGESIELIEFVRNESEGTITARAKSLLLDEEIEPDSGLRGYLEQYAIRAGTAEY